MSAVVMLAGLLILVQGILDVLGIVLVPAPGFVLPFLPIVGVVSIISGLIIIYAGALIARGKTFNGARLAVLFAIVGAAGGGGFIIGSILGLIGGVMKFRVEE
ncbi:MAG TPA: hypothetical protein VIL58_04420 [Thermoplasmata archaeon]